MQYHFRVFEDETGYYASCVELLGCRAEASNRKQLERAMKDALDRYLESPLLHPLPNPDLYGFQEVEPNPGIAFSVLLKQARTRAGLTQKEVCERMRLGSMKKYQRMEVKLRPTPERIGKVQRIFPDFDFLQLVS